MIQTTRILFIVLSICFTSNLLIAHQGHFSKNKSIAVVTASDESVKTEITNSSKNKNVCNESNPASSDCCCCLNGVCLGLDKNCSSKERMASVSCSKQCENRKLDAGNLINENIKTQNLLRAHFKVDFINNQEINSNSPRIYYKAKLQLTPSYISIHSLLI